MDTTINRLSALKGTASGHDFQSCRNSSSTTWALAPARKVTGAEAHAKNRQMRHDQGRALTPSFANTIALLVTLCFATFAFAADLKVPATTTAGNAVTFTAPVAARQRCTSLARERRSSARCNSARITISADELKNAGRYIVSVEGDGDGSFFVTANEVSSIAFLARPSRVPADTHDVISGTAFLFDKYQNLVMQPQPVKFELERQWTEHQPRREVERRSRLRQAGLFQEGRPGAVCGVQRLGFGAARGAGGRVRSVQHSHERPARQERHSGQHRSHSRLRRESRARRNHRDLHLDRREGQEHRGCAHQTWHRAGRACRRATSATISVASGVVVGNEIQWRGGM